MTQPSPNTQTQPNTLPQQNPNQLSPERQRELDQLGPLLDGLTDAGLRDLDDLNRRFQLELRHQADQLADEYDDHLRQSGVTDRLERHEQVNEYMRSPRAQRRLNRIARQIFATDIDDITADLALHLDHTAPDFIDQYDEVYESVVRVAELSTDDWLGDVDADGNYEENGVWDGLNNHLYPRQVAQAPSAPNNPNAPQTPESQNLQERVDALRKEVEHAREHKRSSSVDRQRSSFRGRELAERYQQRDLHEYNKLLRRYLEALVEQQRDQGIDDAAIKNEIAKITNELEAEETTEEKKLLVERGGIWARAMEKYGKLSTFKKIALGVGAGALIGVGMTAFVTGVGFPLGAAAVGMGLFRLVRSYSLAMSKMYAPDNSRPDALSVDPNLSVDELIAACQNYVAQNTTERIKTADKLRRRAVMIGVGSIALGSLAEHALPFVDAATDKMGHAIGDYFHSTSGPGGMEASAAATPPTIEAPVAPSVTDQLRKAAAGNPKLSGLLERQLGGNGELKIPLKHGDGFERLGDRYGLTDAQQSKLEDIMRTHQNSGHSQTYTTKGDLRLNYGDGFLHLSPKEALAVLNAK